MNLTTKVMSGLVLAAGTPSPLFACAACYGQSDSPLAVGMNYGVLTLLGVVVCVLTLCVAGFVHIVRKSETMHREAVKRMEEL